MTNLGKIINSFFNATNENTVALANLNFDFALLKYEAPKEFRVVGANLSSRRRNEAEDGKTHKVAGRLGALFKSIVPSTPNLLNAYGKRASQIAEVSNVNHKNNKNYGPFSEFVGIDGTSLWAAATSAELKGGRHAPLALHLLACILARRWEPAVATSIWVELVDNRQREIEASLCDEPQHVSLFMAAKHEISRDELACWDASARAWLQSADEVKSVETTKLNLIAKNISIDIGSGHQTYQDVIEVWKCAMQGMELLVQGIPQQLSSGAILVALSAWHLYPDLIILEKTTKQVAFQDPLVSPGGTITVGLQFAHEVREPGMHWSLTLSHLRYYEQEVQVEARNDMTRVSMDELLVIAFGNLMASWGVSSANYDDAAQLLVQLHLQVRRPLNESLHADQYDPEWLRIVVLFSRKFLELTQRDQALCASLIDLGRRRVKSFLGFKGSLPFFGLLNPCILPALTGVDGHEAAIIYLRKVAESFETPSRTFLIRCRQAHGSTTFDEFATVTPHTRRSSKRELDGSSEEEDIHQRWLFTNSAQAQCSCNQCGFLCDRCGSLHPSLENGRPTRCETCQFSLPRACQSLIEIDTLRVAEVNDLGEECRWVGHRDLCSFGDNGNVFNRYSQGERQNMQDTFIWRNPPIMLRDKHPVTSRSLPHCPSLENNLQHCICAEPTFDKNSCGADEMLFEKVSGNPSTYCLFRAVDPLSISSNAHINKEKSRERSRWTVKDLKRAHAMLQEGNVARHTLQRYLDCYVSPCGVVLKDPAFIADRSLFDKLLNRRFNMPLDAGSDTPLDPGFDILLDYGSQITQAQKNALRALSFAHRTYKHMPGAFIPLTITLRDLGSVKWLEENSVRFRGMELGYHTRMRNALPTDQALNPFDGGEEDVRLSVARCFACIVFFESGTYDVPAIDCLPVIAVASGNSIFVASYVISDPDFSETEVGLIQRVTGNVGMVGISMLVPPQKVMRVRPLTNDLRVVVHNPFDGQEEDNFASTSLLLSFTKWRRPYNTKSRGTIDEGLFYVESVVSALDYGQWMCDLNVQHVLIGVRKCMWKPQCICEDQGDAGQTISIDNWEELLDSPVTVGIMRAKRNWPARLAALVLRYQLGLVNDTLIVSPDVNICKKCIAAEFIKRTGSECGVLIN